MKEGIWAVNRYQAAGGEAADGSYLMPCLSPASYGPKGKLFSPLSPGNPSQGTPKGLAAVFCLEPQHEAPVALLSCGPIATFPPGKGIPWGSPCPALSILPLPSSLSFPFLTLPPHPAMESKALGSVPALPPRARGAKGQQLGRLCN